MLRSSLGLEAAVCRPQGYRVQGLVFGLRNLLCYSVSACVVALSADSV